MNSFRPLVYPAAEPNATGQVCRDSGLVQCLTIVSGVRRRGAVGEQDEADRRRIPDTTH
jgi:hypothetical protein